MATDGDPGNGTLDEEARCFAGYLLGRPPDEYIIAAYRRLAPAVVDSDDRLAAIDRALLTYARQGTLKARVADAYSRWFRPHGALRRRLVLMIAILECSASSHREFTSGHVAPRWSIPLGLFASGLGFVASLTAGVVLFAPRQLLDRDARPGANS